MRVVESNLKVAQEVYHGAVLASWETTNHKEKCTWTREIDFGLFSKLMRKLMLNNVWRC